MQVIIEVSLYPLTKEYEPPIARFIMKLQSYKSLEIIPGETSTVIRGEYGSVFRMLESECLDALNSDDKAVLVLKVMNTV